MRAISAILCFLALSQFARCDQINGLALPACPKDSVIKVYGPFTLGTDWVRSLPFIDLHRNIHDARPHLEKLGVQFPKGGWAWYFGLGRILIVTVGPENKDTIEMLAD